MQYIQQIYGEQSLLWFKEHRQFLLLDNKVLTLFDKFIAGQKTKEIVKFCKEEYGLTLEQSAQVLEEFKGLVEQVKFVNSIASNSNGVEFNEGDTYSSFCYKFNGIRVQLSFSSKELEQMVRPKFQHLEVSKEECHIDDDSMKLLESSSSYGIVVNGVVRGNWLKNDSHFLLGKLSMEFLNIFNNTDDNDWLATFHASAVFKKEHCVALLGASGSGKSTATSLLVARGYNFLSDDFLPLSVSKKMVCFPSAISIKASNKLKTADLFSESYSSEIYFKQGDTPCRFFYPKSFNKLGGAKKECTTMIFVEYNKKSDNTFEPLSTQKAFELLIPEIWVSSREENVRDFMDWLKGVKFYKLHYSDNVKLIEYVDQLLQNDR